MTRILVVDDEPAIRDALSYALGREGFEVECEEAGEPGLARALGEDFDLLILDLMLPDVPGIEVCRRLRDASALPIVMLTAKDAELDRVLGLELGADDYVTKPFSMPEVVSRIRAILRRRQLDRAVNRHHPHDIGGLQIDPVQHRVLLHDKPVQVTPSEFRLLQFLAEEPGRVFSRREILQHLWSSEYVGDERTCDVHVSNLRRKIEEDPAVPQRLVTVRGFGYKLVSPEP
jgi:two-component system response regulator RegX3